MKPPVPLHEEFRLKDLYSYQILDSEDEQAYTDLVELAAMICNCPVAAITFVDKERQWFKVRKNIDAPETPKDVSFCAHVVFEEEVMIVDNPNEDERFRHNPDVTGGLKIGFYAGAPIFSTDGNALGTLCVVDHQARKLAPEKIEALKIISRQITQLLELRKKNRLALLATEKMIEAEKKTTTRVLEALDKEKADIAYSLHENLAQTLAAAKLYFDMSENAGTLSSVFQEKGKENLNEAITQAQTITRNMVPSTLTGLEVINILPDLLHQFATKNGIVVDFELQQVSGMHFGKKIDLAIYHIIQVHTKKRVRSRAQHIKVNLLIDDMVRLTITDDAMQNNELDEVLLARIHMVKGNCAISENELIVLIPFDGTNELNVVLHDSAEKNRDSIF